MDARALAIRCQELAEEKKAENPLILDLRGLSNITDYFLIAGGTSEPHLRAIVDWIVEKIQEEFGLKPAAIDGTYHTNWVVLDYFDVVAHIMRPETRARYDLEGLWGDAPRIRPRREASDVSG
ncbi:MAG: ribosome silencing factor [Verrucomicrobia bacterium]|nr:ribosome silencing factor [Verrucomicrobiota bacterium]